MGGGELGAREGGEGRRAGGRAAEGRKRRGRRRERGNDGGRERAGSLKIAEMKALG